MVFYTLKFPAKDFWLLGFIGYLTPFLLLLNLLYLLLWAVFSPLKVFLPLVVLIIGFPFIRSSFALDFKENAEKGGLHLINYNVRIFNVYDHLREKNPESPARMLDWIFSQGAEVVCLQEYYNDDNSELFNIKERFIKNGYPYCATSIRIKNRTGAQFGVATFSKLPIVNKEEVIINKQEKNRAVMTDIAYGEDTVRVYNVHFHSMKLKVDELIRERTEKELWDNVRFTLANMKEGFIERSGETQEIVRHAGKARGKEVIICGDLNDMPYSYTYTHLRNDYKNAFEEAGHGFGFTFNAKPYFIRIDNQFFNESIEIIDFKVYNDISYSDHYPIGGWYTFKNN